MKKSFCDRLREVRGQRSQSDVAAILGIKQQAYAKYENGISKPGLDALQSICCNLMVSADWLLGLSENNQTACAPPTVPACADCRRRDDQIDELFSQLRVMRAELEKKGGGSVSPKPSSASGARKKGA